MNDGGQAVVADHFHNHAGGGANAKTDEQSHATGTADEGPALFGPDAQGNRVPSAGREGAETVPNARREKSGRS